MFSLIAKKIFGSVNDRFIKSLQNDVDKMKEGKPVSDLSRRIIETEISDLTTRCGSLSEMHRFLNTSQDYYKQIIYS